MTDSSSTDAAHPDVDAIVIGAGMAGMYMLHRLRGLGLSVQVFEAGDDVGGTWYWNRYPGARCDSESHIYSFSFSEELQREWEWSSTYPDQPEIRAYLDHVADKFDLRRDIRFTTRVTAAVYESETNTWRVSAEDGSSTTARFCISAMGCLSASNIPSIPGLDRFEGRWFHTSDWPDDGVDFAGRRVGVIGTGATGIQIIPSIAPEAGELTVFQRSANYIVPAINTPLSPQTWREFQLHYPAIRERTRQTFACFTFDIGDRSARQTSPEERERTYQSDWRQGGLKFIFGSDFGDLLFDQESNDTAVEFLHRKVREVVHDPDTAEKLIPTTHPAGSKRPLVDTLGYYDAFNRDNVRLVDIGTDPVEEITERGVRTGETEYPLDDLIFATGFDAITGPLLKLDIRGWNGLTLREKWSQGPRTYLGVATSGFPNLFTITGPGSPSVLSNMVVSIEQHVDWIAGCIDYLRANGLDRIEATEDAEESWSEHANEVADATLLPMGASWWRGANVEGKPLVLMPYAGGAAAYRARCNEIAADGYTGFATSSTASTSAAQHGPSAVEPTRTA